MSVRELTLRSWPSMPGGWVRRSLVLARWLATMPTHARAQIAGLGRVDQEIIECRFSDKSAERFQPGEPNSERFRPGESIPERFAFRDGETWAEIAVEAPFGRALVSLLLGAPKPIGARPLTEGERGVLGAIGVELLASLAVPADLKLSRIPVGSGWKADCDIDIAIAVEGPHVLQGRLCLGLNLGTRTGLNAAAVRPPSWTRLRSVPVSAALEIARTSIGRVAFAALESGDIVVFDETLAVANNAVVECMFRIGRSAAVATWDGAGDLRLASNFEMVDAPPDTERILMSKTDERADVTEATAMQGNLAQTIADVPVEVVAELGRVVLSGAEVAGLTAGMVLSFGRPSETVVTLTAGGRAVARGILVDVDGDLGVRVSQRLG